MLFKDFFKYCSYDLPITFVFLFHIKIWVWNNIDEYFSYLLCNNYVFAYTYSHLLWDQVY